MAPFAIDATHISGIVQCRTAATEARTQNISLARSGGFWRC